MTEGITYSMIEPALGLLDVPPSSAHELCCVMTTASKPYVILDADAPWCAVWELPRAQAVGKCLSAIAGPRTSNASVGSRLGSATTEKALDEWQLIDDVVNQTVVSHRLVRHALAIGPVRGPDGSVRALIGISKMKGSGPAHVSPFASLFAQPVVDMRSGEAPAGAAASPSPPGPLLAPCLPSSTLSPPASALRLLRDSEPADEPATAARGEGPVAMAAEAGCRALVPPPTPLFKRRYSTCSPDGASAERGAGAGPGGADSDSDAELHAVPPKGAGEAIGEAAAETTSVYAACSGSLPAVAGAEDPAERAGGGAARCLPIDCGADLLQAATAAEARRPLFVGILLNIPSARESLKSALGKGGGPLRPTASRDTGYRFPRAARHRRGSGRQHVSSELAGAALPD